MFHSFKIGLTGCLLLLLTACNNQKKLESLVYFNQPGDSTLATVVQKAEPIIRSGDRLNITVSALNPTSVAPYNLATTSVAGTVITGYLVDEDGTIDFPQLGKIAVAGKHLRDVKEVLASRLKTFVNDPVVNIQFLNFKITVLGEVNKPGTILVTEGRVNVIEALGMAGDLTLTSRRDNITVIREKDGVRSFGKINLLSKSVFSSPYFVLQQNDVVYVELTAAKAATGDVATIRNIAIGTSLLSVLSTLVVLITNLSR